MSKFNRKYRLKGDSVNLDSQSHFADGNMTEPNESYPLASSDRQERIFTPRTIRRTHDSWNFFDQKPFTTRTANEYVRKIVVLNEFEKKKYPKILFREPQKVDQENATNKAEIDSTGLIRTAIIENTWLNFDIRKHEYVYFSIPVKSRDSPLKLVVQRASGQDSNRDDLKIFMSDLHHRPSSFKFTEVFTTKVVKVRTNNHKTKFDVEEFYFSIFSESSFTAKLRYSFGDDVLIPRYQQGRNKLQKLSSTALLPDIHSQKENDQTVEYKAAQLTDLEVVAREIIRKRRLKTLENANGSNYIVKNKETAGQVFDLEQHRVQIRHKNTQRIMEVQKNRLIRQHESVEKKKFLTQKHDLFRSVTYLHKMYEDNQIQSHTKQKILLQLLFLTNFCHATFDKFQKRADLLLKQRRALFQIKIAARKINKANSHRGLTAKMRMHNEVNMLLLTHAAQLQVSAKKQAKDIVHKFLIDRYKVNKLRAHIYCFRNRIMNVQTKWLNYLRKKSNYKRVLELVWDQSYVAIAVEMQNKKHTRTSDLKRTAVKVDSESTKKKNFVDQYYEQSFKRFYEYYSEYRESVLALEPKVRKTLGYAKFLTQNENHVENSTMMTKLENLDHESNIFFDAELVYKKQKSTLYYPESLFFPPRLFIIPTITELKDYLKAQQKATEAEDLESKTTIIISKARSNSPGSKKRAAIFATQAVSKN